MKTCNKCKQNLPLDKFSKDKTRVDGLAKQCKQCKAKTDKQWLEKNPDYVQTKNTPEYNKQWLEKNPTYMQQYRDSNKKTFEESKEYRLQRKFGIGLEEYDTMLTEQEHKCIICQQQMVTPHVDHDHNTGKVRGLLCMHCNTALGKFKDDVDTLQRAIDYLNRTK